MENNEYNILEDLFYSKEHEWIKKINSKTVLIGITDYAAKILNDIVYVELPEVDKDYNISEILGSVESIKAVSDIYSPLKGKIKKINEKLITKPELINISPYNNGWIIELENDNLEKDLSELMNNKQYSEYVNDIIK
tara:strand:+ start:692 stop:1102 length:411 start_codon:yes stop_codon:yes gene_type:complete